MAWVAVLRRRDGGESVLGLHPSYTAARRQADEFNRRYQIDAARVEEYDPGTSPWPFPER